jgi:outer membrane protein assembly factor BamC
MAIAGCASKEKKADYETAPPQRSALEVPPDLTKPKTDAALSVPEPAPQRQPATGSTAQGATTQPSSSSDILIGEPVLPNFDNVRMQRAGSQRWLVVNMPPARVWDAAQQFLTQHKFEIETASRETGILETEWSESRPLVGSGFHKTLSKTLGSKYSNAFRDKFRFRLERGKLPDTTELYISHRGMEEVIASQSTGAVETVWQGRPNDPELEAVMLAEFLVQIGLSEQHALGVVTAPRPADEAALHITGDKVSLQVRDTLDSAWKRVGLALDRVGWVVENRNVEARTYRVHQVDIVEPKKKKGFLGLFGDDEPVEKQRAFEVALTENADVIEVTLRDPGGVPVPRKEAQPLMEALYSQLR